MQPVQVIDSHTAGEPTRVVVDGGPDLGSGPLSQRRELLAQNFDDFRSAVVNEPRGADVVVGALVCPPEDPHSAAAVIFFNNVGYLGMCGHGTIGLLVTLAHLGRIRPGPHRIETPVGIVQTTLHDDHRVTVRNVPSYRHAAGVEVWLQEGARVTGDVAWGGNWFFLTNDHGLALEPTNVSQLHQHAWSIRHALTRAQITGAAGAQIDHIELFGPAASPTNHGRNFVLCPGGAYDRSPCGTGTSARLACLAAAGQLAQGQPWRQEGILGTVFVGSYQRDGEQVVPSFTGEAYITAEATLHFDPADPFRTGIRL